MNRIARAITTFNLAVGAAVSWLMIAIVFVQFAVVLLRYVFGVGSIWAQESILYMHGFLFMLTAGYSLAVNAHVRVDVFYREAAPAARAAVDLVGAVLFLLPMCVVIWVQSWPFVAMAWSILEGSRETSGIPAIFVLKTAILAYAGLLALQGLALILRAAAALAGPDAVRSAYSAGRE
ncbi:TRAP transporter small permease subunit [Polymorphum gilvum]|uniref:TRAP transporter small permease protein n=1 Tax=Polymorphum gilvum (strain LMG 25793 / CGMCC 1.9160 / SL003B-26A1) TaxID=991905 RepID=F2IWF7_POLGS|nr:TRAP transporter small permease subunit [Polymorphum gilvum]ADZ69256.1 TRAP-type mannitol/chloroaromatic compound transport system, small permease component [Polymorphum gilvum SL003B-26A1]